MSGKLNPTITPNPLDQGVIRLAESVVGPLMNQGGHCVTRASGFSLPQLYNQYLEIMEITQNMRDSQIRVGPLPNRHHHQGGDEVYYRPERKTDVAINNLTRGGDYDHRRGDQDVH